NYVEALRELKLADELGRSRPDWAVPSGALVRHCERAIALVPRLPTVLIGDDKPRDAEEAATFAQLCSDRGMHQKAVQFWTESLSTEPNLAMDRHNQYRACAAFDAALAGCGRGGDASLPDESARAKLRALALRWLTEELKAWSRFLESAPFPARQMG